MSNWVKVQDVVEALDKLPQRVVHDYGEYYHKDYVTRWLQNYAHASLSNSCQDHCIVEWVEQMIQEWKEETDGSGNR